MINYSLRGESEFSKLYKEKGSYNVSKKQIENGVSYVDMMRENMKALKKALY